jgi:hypothetical protein
MSPLYDFDGGNKIRFRTGDGTSGLSDDTPFTAIEAGGTPIDPDVTQFKLAKNGADADTFTYTWGASPPDPSFTIVRLATGDYKAEFDDVTDDDEYWEGQWLCHSDDAVNHDTTKTKVAGKVIRVIIRDSGL